MHRNVVSIAALVAGVMVASTVVGASSPGPGDRTNAAVPPPPGLDLMGTGRSVDDFDASRSLAMLDPDRVVQAIVLVDAPSVADTKQQHDDDHSTFDEHDARRDAIEARTTSLTTLERRGVHVEATLDTVLNGAVVRARVRDLRAAATTAGIRAVTLTQPIRPTNFNSGIATGTFDAWTSFGFTGKGITIGIVDTGIDYFHADFGGSGDPADFVTDDPVVAEPGSFPTAKVVGGHDFVGDESVEAPGSTAAPDEDPSDCNGHGTFVAGTAAGMGVLADGSTYRGPYTSEAIDRQSWLVHPGAAPEASLRMYRAFACDGSTTDALLIQAIDRAAADHVDVLSLSFGTPAGTGSDLVERAVDNATRLGVLTVAAAGNDGHIPYAVSSPSTAGTALSVAAADLMPQAIVDIPGRVVISGDITLNTANTNWYPFPTGPVTGTLRSIGDACAPGAIESAREWVGVGTFDQHRCDLGEFFRRVDFAGPRALVLIDDELADQEWFPFGQYPVLIVSSAIGAQFTAGKVITMRKLPDTIGHEPNADYGNIASFTSAGLRSDSAPKPDVAANGMGVESAGMGSGTRPARGSGTSSSAAHVAGIAALVRQAHPDWSPLDVKGVIASTADPTAVRAPDVALIGTGLVRASAALASPAHFATRDGLGSLAFGFAELLDPARLTRRIRLVNHGSTPLVYDLSTETGTIAGMEGLSVDVSPRTVRVGAGSSAAIDVTVRIRDPWNLPSGKVDERQDCSACAWVRGALVATPRAPGMAMLRAALVLVPRGVSDVTPMLRDVDEGETPRIRLVNRGRHAATVDVLERLIGDRTGDTVDSAVPDIRDVGVDRIVSPLGEPSLEFTIATQQRMVTQWSSEYDVWFDVDLDGDDDIVLIIVNDVAAAIEPGRRPILAFSPNRWMLNHSLVSGSIPIQVLEDAGAAGPVSIRVTAEAAGSLSIDEAGPVVFDTRRTTVGTVRGVQLAGGQRLTVTPQLAAGVARAQGTLGWLVVSDDDAAGPASADRVPLRPTR
ncbi:MAG: S8 family peptidase [Ilumatobacteraceae bacterium]